MSGTITYPIELPPEVIHMQQLGMPWDFVLSLSNWQRSLEFVNVPVQPDLLPVGSFVDADGLLATAPANIRYIVCYPVDATVGVDRVTVVARDAEVKDAYLAYGTLPRNAVNTHLRDNLNIIVREGVLPTAMNSTFSGQGF